MTYLEKIEYVRQNAGKLTVKEMADHLGVPYSSVSSYASRAGVSTVKPETIERRRVLRHHITTFHKTHTCREVSKMIREAGLHISTPALQSYAGKMGIYFKRERNEPRKIDESKYFKIDRVCLITGMVI